VKIIPFGKFKGTPLEELPAQYLVWLSQLDDLRDPLRGAVVVELGRRVLAQSGAQESETRAAGRRPVLAAAGGGAAALHIGDVDQDGQELPF